MQTAFSVEVGQSVSIQSRTFPGTNKPGGAAIITAIHLDETSGKPIRVDVRYMLGGREANVEMTYVAPPVVEEGRRRGTRERKQDVKMNLAEEQPKKKRTALKDIDGNVSKKQKTAEKEDELPAGCEMDGEWMRIKSGKLSDYTPYLTKGTSVQFWWDDKKGWLHATLLKDIKRQLGRGIIRWMVNMQFEEDDETFSYCFHPKDNRWKIKIDNTTKKDSDETSTVMEAKASKKPKKTKKPVVKRSDDTKNPKNDTFAIAVDSDSVDDILNEMATDKKKAQASIKEDEKGMSNKSNQEFAPKEEALPKVTPATKSDPIDLGVLNKVTTTKSKPSAGSTKFAAKTAKQTESLTKKNVPANLSSSCGDEIVVIKSKPATTFTSFQATSSFIKPAASKLFAQQKQATIPAASFHKSSRSMKTSSGSFYRTQLPAATIAASFTLPAKVESKIKEISSKTIKRSKEINVSAAAKPAGPKTTGVMTVTTGFDYSAKLVKSGPTNRPKTHAQVLREKAQKEAEDFMNSLKDKEPEEDSAKKPFSSSSDESISSGGDLSLEVVRDRKDIFNEGFTEVFFKPNELEMEVNTFITKLNAHTAFRKYDKFALPEVIEYLKVLEKTNKIMIHWADGAIGIIYNCC